MVAKFKKKRRGGSWKDLGFAIFLIILVIFIVAFLVYQNSKIHRYRANLTSRIKSLQEELQRLKEQKALLEKGVSQSGEEEFVEQEAREKLNLKKEGENVVAFVLPETGEKKEEQKNPWNPKNWWEWLKSKF